MTDVITVMIAYALCFALAKIVKLYVQTYCMDNPEIFWIWLDDDITPDGGHRIEVDKTVYEEPFEFNPCPVPCLSGI